MIKIRNILVLFAILALSTAVYGQLVSCTYTVDLSPPYIDTTTSPLYPSPGDTVNDLFQVFGAPLKDDGAGVWLNHVQAESVWDTLCGADIGTYITWAVNDFSSSNFVDTVWDSTFASDTFNYNDSIKACIHGIDRILNFGEDCSCCPNEFDSCWVFHIAPCDSYRLVNICPSPCEIITANERQAVWWSLVPVPGSGNRYPDTASIIVEVYVDGVLADSGTIASLEWAHYIGNPIDRIFPDTIMVEPPGTTWSHGDSVAIVVYSTQCPIILSDTCWFMVDLVPPHITYHYPAPSETVFTPFVNLIAILDDDFAGVRRGGTVVHVTIWDSLGGLRGDYDVPTPFTDTINFMIPLITGDSIKICIRADDDVDFQLMMGGDTCTAPPNRMDSCWTFYVLISQPIATLIEPIDLNGDGRVITACDDQHIRIVIYDKVGMDSTPVVLRVNGVRYDDLVLRTTGMLTRHGDDSLVIDFDPTPFGIFWRDGEWVYIRIDTAFNRIGYNLASPLVDSFLVDLSPPVFFGMYPPDGTVLYDSSVTVSIHVRDSICDNPVIDSVRVRGIVRGDTVDYWVDSSFVGDADFSYTLDSLHTGDSVHVCAWASDPCHDYCGVNSDSICWWFKTILGEMRATLIEPVDLNGDGRVISTCDDQKIIWTIWHTHPVDTSSIRVTVAGSTYVISDSELVLSNDTIYFIPSTLWHNGDSIYFCLDSISDTIGTALYAPVCGWVVIDLEGPVFYSLSPLPSASIPWYGAEFGIRAVDSICGFVSVDSMQIHSFSGAFDTSFVPSRDGDSLGPFLGGDTLLVCAFAHDGCQDYCDDNLSDTCWLVPVETTVVTATVIEPVDLNADGRVISTCNDQGAVWILDYTAPIDTTTITVLVNGVTYTYPSPSLSLSGDTLRFTPPTTFFDRDSIVYCLVRADDIAGGKLSDTVCTYAIIDLSPPVLVSTSPPIGIPIHSTSATINATFYDSVCTSMTDFVDSVWAYVYRGGVVVDSVIGFSMPIVLLSLADGDTMSVCVAVSDGCQDYCDDNFDTICWEYTVHLGVPWAEFISPPDTNHDGRRISTCERQGFVIYAHESYGMDTTVVHLLVEGVSYNAGSPEVSLSYVGDSTTMKIEFVPSTPWRSGQWVHVVLDTALNLLGDNLGFALVDSYLIDLDPPVYTYSGPAACCVGMTAVISVTAYDSICDGDVSLDSVVVTSSVGRHDILPGGAGTITGLVDGENVRVCAYAHDLCSDTCGPNFGDSCWNFVVDIGDVYARVVEPVDSNGDGRVISNCDDQRIVWLISHDYGLDLATLVVHVDGVRYGISSAELSFSSDSVIFSPGHIWHDGDSIYFCLDSLCDTTGGCLDSAVCGYVVIDLSPPVLSSITPPPGTHIYTDSFSVSYSLWDSICGAGYDIVSIDVSSSPPGATLSVSTDSLTVNISDIPISSDIYLVIDYRDNCADYCNPNTALDTLVYHSLISEVTARLLKPFDLNRDSCIQTACECQKIVWLVKSYQGIDTTTLEVMVDGRTYRWGPYLSLDRVSGIDTMWYLTFDPAVAGTCWHENGYIVEHEIVRLLDTLGHDSIVHLDSSFQILIEPPIITLSPFPDDTPWCADTLSLSFSIFDSFACTYYGDGTARRVRDGMTYEIIHIPVGDTTIRNIRVGDSVCISLTSTNVTDYNSACAESLGYNVGHFDTCFYFWCPCYAWVFAGPDKVSCPGAPVTLGCEVPDSGFFDAISLRWYLAGASTPFASEANPVVTPETTTTYILEGQVICLSGDTLLVYDTVVVRIDYEPPTRPQIVLPVDGSTIMAGENDLVWHSSSGTEPIYYKVIVNGTVIADSLTDTVAQFNINCDETLRIAVVAFNQCSYTLDYGCYGDSTHSGTIPAVYETSAVLTVFGEPCGGPRALAIYPEPFVITACSSQVARFVVWDMANVQLVPESLVVTINGVYCPYGVPFVNYTAVDEDSGVVEVHPPSGVWNDNDTIVITLSRIQNRFGIELMATATVTFYTDFSPPVAELIYPDTASAVDDLTPNIDIGVTDNVAGVAVESLSVRVSARNGNVDTTVAVDGASVEWIDSTVIVHCEQLGIEFASGETVDVVINTQDLVSTDYCGPNRAIYRFWFYYPMVYSCASYPNPFTPNYDNINDYCQFTYPGLGEKDADIYIFTLDEHLVAEVHVPASDRAKEEARWNGNGKDGKPLPVGLYVYIIVVDGEVICEGTVTIAR